MRRGHDAVVLVVHTVEEGVGVLFVVGEWGVVVVVICAEGGAGRHGHIGEAGGVLLEEELCVVFLFVFEGGVPCWGGCFEFALLERFVGRV